MCHHSISVHKHSKKKIWDEETIRARGLFINTNLNKIVARSYNKFFNIDEMPLTKLGNLELNFEYPVSVYRKYNGYLGLLGYNPETDELMYCSKSTNEAEVTAYLMDKLDKQYYDQIEKVVKFSCMTKINYDCLRAIAFELNNGYEFEESINDLNILHLDDSNSYCTVEVTYKNEKVFRRSLKFNLFDPNESTIIRATDKGSRPIGEVKIAFNNVDIDMAKHKEYFATISDLRIESLDLYKAYDEEERLELENYYLDSDNIVMACIKKDSDKNKNKRFF